MWRYWHGNWFCGPGSFFGGNWGGLLNLLFWLAVILLVVWLVRSLISKRDKRSSSLPPSPPSPLEILKRRYASGEIDREEFERMKREIRQEA